MGVYAGPDVSESGLMLALDAANLKSFDKFENLTVQTSQIGVSPTYSASGIVGLNTTATTDPNGGNQASTLDNNGNTSANYVFGSAAVGLTTNTTYTYSIHIKQGTKPDFQITIDENGFGGKRYYSIFTYSNESVTTGITGAANDGVVVGSTATKLTNGWYRLSLTFRTSTTAASGFVDMINRFGNTSGSNYVWGRQLEIGDTTTDYYATTTTAKNRGTIWTDLSGRGITGTLTNGPTYSSSNGGSIVFDGTNDYVTAGTLSGSFTSFTVITWFYPTAVVNYNNVLDCNSGYYTSGNIGPRLEMNSSGTLGWVYSNITGDNNQFYYQNVVDSGLSANTWHCAAITYNGSGNSSITYYNGNATAISRGTVGTPTGFVGSINSLNIGRGFANGRYFQGRIAHTQIYNKALTASEIKQNFNAARSRFGL